jgi:3-oxoacyl-[acyl-carrier protein] reductase
MIPDLKNKVVLITGASTGIGAAAALGFGANGARVAVHYNSSEEAANKVAAGIREAGAEAITIRGDVTDTATVKAIIDKTVAHFGRIDVLINNAGALVRRCPIAEMTDELFDSVVSLNVRSVAPHAARRSAFPPARRRQHH